jgi:hypothetical protein
MKCPCENCLCVPICRNKLYFTLFSDCCLICKYVKITDNDNSTLKITQNILQSPWWGVSGKSNITITLEKKS